MGPYLSAPKTEKETLTGENDKYSFAATEMQGWRTTMEDAKLVELNLDADTVLLGVFDGHGGKDVAKYISLSFKDLLLESQHYQEGRYEQALTETFLKMDQKLTTTEALSRISELSGEGLNPLDLVNNSGCTAVVALIRGNQVIVANAGDSRCVVGDGRRAVALSNDHKPELPIEKARIEAAGSVVDEGRVNGSLNLSRSLGDLRFKSNSSVPQKDQAITADPDIQTLTLTRTSNFIVLACDGIWDILSNQECVDFIYERIDRMSLKEINEEMMERCLAKDALTSEGIGCDNMTLVILSLKHCYRLASKKP